MHRSLYLAGAACWLSGAVALYVLVAGLAGPVYIGSLGIDVAAATTGWQTMVMLAAGLCVIGTILVAAGAITQKLKS